MIVWAVVFTGMVTAAMWLLVKWLDKDTGDLRSLFNGSMRDEDDG